MIATARGTGTRSARVPTGAAGSRSSPDDGRCHPRPRWTAIALAALAGVSAGCASGTGSAAHNTTSTTATHHAPKSKSKSTAPAPPTTTTTVPASTSTTPPVQTSSIEVRISGPTVSLNFLSANLTGALSTASAVFTQGGTIFDFIVTGVSYSESAITTSSSVAGGLVSQVVVSPTNGGITVEVKLSEPASHHTFGLGHNEVGVILS